jgi:hypothetical protein
MALLRRHSLTLAKRLAKGNFLKPEWTPKHAADWIWHRIHLDGWRHLVGERGWSAAEYGRRVSQSLQRDLVRSS